MLLVGFLLFTGPVAFLCLIAYGSHKKASQSAREAQVAAIYAANLEGQLAQSLHDAERLAGITREALRCATEVHFPAHVSKDERMAYAPPVNAFCPSCNVSVRHEASEYPVHCPACQTLIDPTFDNPPDF